MQKEWQGIVYNPSLKGGKDSCQLRLNGTWLYAKTSLKKELKLDLNKAHFKWGGTGKSLLMISDKNVDNELTFSIRDESFLTALKQEAGNVDLLEQVNSLQYKSAKKKTWLVASLLFIILFIAGFGVLSLTQGVELATSVIPYSVDKKLGAISFESSIKEIAGRNKICNSKTIQTCVDKIIQRLSKNLENNPFVFEIKVVKSSQINAFALPGGKIAVFTGLLKSAQTPQEVAGVLAHEISHVTCRHSMKAIVRKAGLYLMIMALTWDTNSLIDFILSKSAKLADLKFSRKMELEADYKAFILLKKTRIDPKYMRIFFQKLLSQRGDHNFRWLSTHPLTSSRIQKMKKLEAKLKNFQSEPFNINWEKVQKELKKY